MEQGKGTKLLLYSFIGIATGALLMFSFYLGFRFGYKAKNVPEKIIEMPIIPKIKKKPKSDSKLEELLAEVDSYRGSSK